MTDILYGDDLETVKDVFQAFVQIALRLDRQFPNEEETKAATRILLEAKEVVEAAAKQLEGMSLDELATQVRSVI